MMRVPKSLMVANWKMHKTVLESQAFARELVRRVGERHSLTTEQVICPTLPALYPVSQRLRGTAIRLGAQNLDLGRVGANTGAVSGYLVREAGADYVILGHSERRTLYGEDDGLVALKAVSALNAHLTPIVCVGETLDERQNGQTDTVIRRQAAAVMQALADRQAAPLIFAYEPIWAIGSGLVPEPAEANRVAQLLHEVAGSSWASFLRVLYGGSVKPANAAGFAAQPLVDGALVGGASLTVDSWLELNQTWG